LHGVGTAVNVRGKTGTRGDVQQMKFGSQRDTWTRRGRGRGGENRKVPEVRGRGKGVLSKYLEKFTKGVADQEGGNGQRRGNK